ncbi:hypothetical protein ABZP36_034437 [Zizania latifolia]
MPPAGEEKQRVKNWAVKRIGCASHSPSRMISYDGFGRTTPYRITQEYSRNLYHAIHDEMIQFKQPNMLRATDLGQIEIKVVMELSKKMSIDLGGATLEPVKPREKPLAGIVKDEQAELAPSVEKNHVPQAGQTTLCPNTANDGAQTNPNSEGAAEKMVEETQSSEIADHPKELNEIAQGL